MSQSKEYSSALPPTIAWTGEAVRIIDQRQLPHRLAFLELTTWEAVGEAIADMAVRGAPAIGCAAALAMVLLARSVEGLPDKEGLEHIIAGARRLERVRPTAVNLMWGVRRVLVAIERAAASKRSAVAEAEAVRMLEEDVRVNHAIGRHGAEVLPENCAVLTHCNAGSLATVHYGTALGVIRSAWATGKLRQVYADETRPRLQGLQLTAWELVAEGVPVTVIPDGSAAWLMKHGEVDAVVVGADRIARNGDAANKIGTYGLALAAAHHQIPFYVAAPVSTVDWSVASGNEIPIEERSAEEVTHIGGLRLAPEGVSVWNPAFDVTPAKLITAIITEYGVFPASPEGLEELHKCATGGTIVGTESDKADSQRS